MATTNTYPVSGELREISQDYIARKTMDSPIFRELPIVEQEGFTVIWDQRDNVVGLQQARGMGGEPPVVKPVGGKRWSITPGIYGEHSPIDEEELTTSRRFGTFATPADLNEPVMRRTDQLVSRGVQREEWLGWNLAQGSYTVLDPKGATVHTDTFSVQTFAAGIGWATSATSTPLADFRAIPLLGRGHSVNLGAPATAYMNRTTWNRLASNTNTNDIFGRRTNYGATINDPADFNRIFNGQDLPTIELYDDGYYDDTNTFQLYIPTAKVIVFGRRTRGEVNGNLVLTANSNNPGNAPGIYTKVTDNGDRAVPREIKVHHGMNIAPVLWFPSSIVVMTV